MKSSDRVDFNTVVGVAVDISENRQQMNKCAILTPIYNFWIHILTPLGLLICKFYYFHKFLNMYHLYQKIFILFKGAKIQTYTIAFWPIRGKSL